MTNEDLEKARRMYLAVEFLRSEEADSVEIMCDNPEFHGPNNAVECNGFWTKHTNERFTGEREPRLGPHAVELRQVR